MEEFNFEDADIEYSVACYTDAEGNSYNYSGWVPLEPALASYEECLNEPWTKRAVLIKRESYYYNIKDDRKIVLEKRTCGDDCIW